MKNINLKHESLVYNKNDTFKGEVYIVNDSEAFDTDVTIKIYDEENNIISNITEHANIEQNGVLKITDIEFIIGGSSCYHIDLIFNDEINTVRSNYFFLVKNDDGYCDKQPVIKIYDLYNKN